MTGTQSGLFDEDNSTKFFKFHESNPFVYQTFCKRTIQMIEAGRKHYSARAIIEVVRWDIDVQTSAEEFKINNNHIPFYARMFMTAYPEHDGFFRTRK